MPRLDYELLVGEDLTVLCPGASLEAIVLWEHDSMALEEPSGDVTARQLATTTTKRPGFFQRWQERRRKAGAIESIAWTIWSRVRIFQKNI